MRKIALTFVLIGITTIAFPQADTAHVRKTRMYSLSDDFTTIVPLKMDTMITDFQDHKVINRYTPFYASLGNYGLPVLELDFFKRNIDQDNFVYRHYLPYMHHPGNKVFIDTQVPFTELLFTFGGGRTQAEQTFQVRHSQNVNRFLNFGFDFDVINSLGQYSYQASDNKSFTLHSSYTGNKYKLYTAWSLNSFSGGRNGGISDISQIETLDTRDLPTNLGGLSDASSKFSSMDLLMVQKYTVGGSAKPEADTSRTRKGSGVSGTFSHIFSLERGRMFYADDYPENDYYDTTYISGTKNNVPTFDSLFYRVLRNSLRFDFSTGDDRKFQFDIGVGISNELNVYKQIRPSFDTIFFSDTLEWNRSSNAVFGSLENKIGEGFGWQASGKLYLTGMKAGDIKLKGKIYARFGKGRLASELYGKGYFINQQPSFWLQSWGSNNFIWNNDFGKELRIKVGGGYSIPGIQMDLSLDYTLVTNYIWFNNEALPAQYDGAISVLALRVNKGFGFWKFRWDNKVLLQQTSHQDIIKLPFISAKSSFYFDHLFYFKITDGRLGFQIGLDAIYNTSYFADAFNPATGFYHNQDQQEVGNYPYVNAFINLKLKRTRIFVAFEHVNHGMFELGSAYSYVPSYLMPVRMFKYGVAWTFYD